MTPELYTAAGLGALSWFARARLPSVPHRVSEAGILASVGLVIWAVGFPTTMPPLSTLVLFFVAALCVGGGIHFWQAKGAKIAKPPEVAAPSKGEESMSDKPSQSTSGKNSPIINAPTNNTHFGDITVVGKPARHITEDSKRGLLQIDKTKPVQVLYRNGDAEAANLAQEIYDFLKSAGYQVQPDGIGWHQFELQPQDITISPFNNGAETFVKTESRR